MRSFTKGVILFVIMIFCASLLPAEYKAGDWVELQAVKPAGVPLHSKAENSFTGKRAPDGSKVKILATEGDGHWLKFKWTDGKEYWVVERYVRGEANSPEPVVITTPERPGKSKNDNDWMAWAGEQGCACLKNKETLYPKSNEMIRAGTWNVRWFPSDSTNIKWLACAIAYMNVDILAVQEFKHDDEAKTAIKKLALLLNAKTGGKWKIDLHECGQAQSQHVGFIWNSSRLNVSGFKDMWEFNSRADASSSPCKGNLRPGRYCYVKSKQGGVDFHMISVHSKSSPKPSSQQERFEVLNRLGEAAAPLMEKDEDMIVLGDFNTMGDGSPDSAEKEIQSLKTICQQQNPAFLHFNVSPACSEYYKGHGGWLDHVLVTQTMQEIPFYNAYVQGYCKVVLCGHITGDMPQAYVQLSDHCPVVFEITDKDLDN